MQEKRKMYKSIENDIEYLVFESYDYFYITTYHIKDKKFPNGYEDMKYTKYIKYDNDGRTDINYFYKNSHHNLHCPSFIRLYGENIYGESYYIYGKRYTKEEWEKEKNIFFRKEKIEKILNNLVNQK